MQPLFRRAFLGSLMSILMGSSFAFCAHAFSIQPAIIDLEADPGKSTQGELIVTNDEGVSRNISVSIQRFLPLGDAGMQQFLPAEEREGLPSWIKIPATFSLAPGQTYHVPFQIDVPQNAIPGGYYVAVFFTADGTHQPTDRIAVTTRTGSLLFFTVHGNAHPVLHVLDAMSVTSSALWPTGFDVRLQNTGTVHAIPQGYLALKNMFGQVSHVLPFNTDGGRILPDSTRTFHVNGVEATPAKAGFWGHVQEEWNFFGCGVYHAEFVWSDPSLMTGAMPQVMFAIWPWHLGLVIVGVLLVAAIVYRLLRRRR